MAAALRPARALPFLPSRTSTTNWAFLNAPGSSYLLLAPFSTSSRRTAGVRTSGKNIKFPASQTSRGSPSPTSMTPKTLDSHQLARMQGGIIIFPMTVIAPSFYRYPRNPLNFFRYAWRTVKTKAMDFLGILSFSIASKPGILKPARFKPGRSSIVPTAKALHRTMSEAFARGDKDVLRKITTDALFNRLSAVIHARPPGRRYEWELIKYNSALRYPRVVSHKLVVLPSPAKGFPAPAIQQVVVAISSRQRLVQYDARGRVVDGSEKEVDLVENVVLSAAIDSRTYNRTQWWVTGTLGETTLKQILDDEKLLKQAQEENLAQYRS